MKILVQNLFILRMDKNIHLELAQTANQGALFDESAVPSVWALGSSQPAELAKCHIWCQDSDNAHVGD